MDTKHIATCGTLAGNRPSVAANSSKLYVGDPSEVSGSHMPEPIDAILPVLQRIQGDIATLGRKVDAQGETLRQHGEKLDAIEGYLTYQLGTSSRTIADVEALKTGILDIKKRVEVLELDDLAP